MSKLNQLPQEVYDKITDYLDPQDFERLAATSSANSAYAPRDWYYGKRITPNESERMNANRRLYMHEQAPARNHLFRVVIYDYHSMVEHVGFTDRETFEEMALTEMPTSVISSDYYVVATIKDLERKLQTANAPNNRYFAVVYKIPKYKLALDLEDGERNYRHQKNPTAQAGADMIDPYTALWLNT